MNYMREAYRLAELGRYSTAPNPMVGCIIELNGKIVGKGFHTKAGLPHAEIIALEKAGAKAKDANLYVTLEPCCHHGKTPPCVDAIIKAKIKSVHVALVDPNPLVNGKGIKKLRAAGIKVYVGEEKEAAYQQNEIFLHYIVKKAPFVVAKWAMTMDGQIATTSGEAKWITSEKSRAHARRTRAWLGAVLVGANTIIIDNPNLSEYQNPKRIILDGLGKSPLHSKVFNSGQLSQTYVATTLRSSPGWRQTLIDKGILVLIFPEKRPGKIAIATLLNELGKIGISGLLVEGGQTVLTEFFKEKLVNKTHIYIAPKLIGGKYSPLAKLEIINMSQAIKLKNTTWKMIGDDSFLSAIPEWEDPCLQV